MTQYDASGVVEVILSTSGHACWMCGRQPMPDGLDPTEQTAWAEATAAAHRTRHEAIRNAPVRLHPR